MPELRRFFFWCFSRWLAGDELGSGCGSSACSGGVDGGSDGSEVGAGDAGVDACDTPEALLVASDEADELVASRRYSTTSQVCSVASGAKETRRLAVLVSVTLQLWLVASRRTERFATSIASLLLVLIVGGEN